MNRNDAMALLREINEANTKAGESIVSAAAQGRAAEADWVKTMKEESSVVPADEFFVMNTDRIIN